jgi:hypothetical protein
MNKTKLFLLSSSCLALFICLNNGYAQNGNSPEELYAECVRVAGKSFCDFLFRKDSVNPTNMTAISPSNYTQTTNSTNLSNSTYLTYKDNDLGFRIQYPSDWTIENRNAQFSSVIGFIAPDGISEVDVRVFPKGDYKSIKEVGDEEFKNSDVYTLLGYYRNSTTMLDGKPAFRAVYLYTYKPTLFENEFGYKSSISKGTFIGTLVPEKKSIYALAYLADPPDFDNNRPIFEKMIDSFKIYGKGPVIQEDNSSSTVP